MTDPTWRIKTRRQVKSVLRRLPKHIYERIEAAIDALAIEPHPQGSVKLAGHENLYRVRVGDWRITYSIEDDVMLIVIVELKPRGDAYRNL